MAADSLAQRAEALKEALEWSNTLSTNACSALDHYSRRLVELEALIAPVAQRTASLLRARENIKKAREKAEEVLDHLDTSRKVEAKILAGPKTDLDGFLRALERLDLAIQFLGEHRSLHTAEDALRQASDLRNDALKLSLEEFTQVLRVNSNVPTSLLMSPAFESAVSTPTKGGGSAIGAATATFELLPSTVIPRLQKLANAMLQSGETACLKVYCEVRRGVLERTLQGLGNQTSSQDDYSKMNWPALEKKIQGWIMALRVLVRMIVAEHQIARAIFASPEDELAFSEVITRAMMNNASFGSNIIAARKSPEKVFGLLDMHEQLEEQLPAIFTTLEGTRCAGVLQELVALNLAMQREARLTFAEFEASIQRDSFKHVVADGTVHPLTAYTLSFLKRLFSFKSAMAILFSDRLPDTAPPLSTARKQIMRQGSLAVAEANGARLVKSLTHLLGVLEANLEAKARSYKNRALAALFLMNNAHYMVKTVEASEALQVLGPAWAEQHKDQVERYGEEYQKLSWGPLTALVRDDDIGGRQSWAKEKGGIKDKFRQLNAALAGLHAAQSSWTIPDPLLRANMKEAIAEDFLPHYKDFLERYKAVPFSKTPEKYIKYRVEDVQQMLIADFFEMKEDVAGAKSDASFRGPSLLSRMA